MTRVSLRSRLGRQSEAGRARLKKYVVTEEVTQTVPVQREKCGLKPSRSPTPNVGAATLGPAISEEEHEIVLTEEEPVVEKRPVPRERVRMTKDRVTDEKQVSQEVRKEHIETGIRR